MLHHADTAGMLRGQVEDLIASRCLTVSCHPFEKDLVISAAYDHARAGFDRWVLVYVETSDFKAVSARSWSTFGRGYRRLLRERAAHNGVSIDFGGFWFTKHHDGPQGRWFCCTVRDPRW